MIRKILEAIDSVESLRKLPWDTLRYYDRRHEVYDAEKVIDLVARMRESGWVGPPLVAVDQRLMTGVHRSAALDEIVDSGDVGNLDISNIPVLVVRTGTHGYGDDNSDFVDLLGGDSDDVAEALELIGCVEAAHLVKSEGWPA